MTDRSEERVSVHDSERVAARDYVEVHDYHENNTTNISAPGSTIVVTPPARPPRRPHRPNLGKCKDCHAAISIYAAECPHCGFNPAIEAQRKQDDGQAALLVFGLCCAGTAAVVYQVTEWVGLFAENRMKVSMVGGVLIVMAAVIWWMWNARPRG